MNPDSIVVLLHKSPRRMNQNSWWQVTIASTTLWFIWFARCHRIFQNTYFNLDILVKKILKFSHEQQVLTYWKELSFPTEPKDSSYRFTIMTEWSFVSNQSLAGIGWTLNDNQGNLVAARASLIRFDNALVTELNAILTGINEISFRGLSNFLLLIDSLILYQLISGASSEHLRKQNRQRVFANAEL